MPLPLRFLLLLSAFAASVVSAQERRKGDAWEGDHYEEQVIFRAMGRHQVFDTEGKIWEREMAKAFPTKHKAGHTDADVEKWFDLLSGGDREWRRDGAPTKAIAGYFDQVSQHLQLGPVPSIRREEFMQFARGRLSTPPPREPKAEDKSIDADRAFRVLDRDGSGSLEATEWTEPLRNDIKNADDDGNRRISPEEYRVYFARQVVAKAEAFAAVRAKMEAAGGGSREGKWPDLLKKIDTDEDGQIGLYEWRASGRAIEEFLEMDLDGDGLLPPEEFMRYQAKLDMLRPREEKKPMGRK